MSFLSTYISCPNLQDSLDKYFSQMNPSLVMESAGVLDFLMSDTNTMGVNIGGVVSPGGGKRRVVDLVYRPRIPESKVAANYNLTCTPTDAIGDTSAQYDIDPDSYGHSFSWITPIKDLDLNCPNKQFYFEEQLMSAINVLDRDVAQAAVTQLVGNAGAFVEPTGDTNPTVKEVQTVDASGNNTQNLLEEVQYNSKNNEFNGRSYIFGWGELDKYFTRLDAGCCVQTGIDLDEFNRQSPYIYMPDYRVPDTFAAVNSGIPFIALNAGSVQPIFYNRLMDDALGTSGDDSFHTGTIRSPRTGIWYDFLSQKTCTGNDVSVSFSLRASMKLVYMPADMFCDGDRLEGINGYNQYEIVN